MGIMELLSARLARRARHRRGVEPDELGAAEPVGRFACDDATLTRCLRDAGVPVASVWELLEARQPCPEAIPALVAALPQVVDLRIKQAIARGLAVAEARPLAAGALWNEFLAAPAWKRRELQVKWAIGYALGVASDDSVFGAVESLLRDRSHGWTRTGLVYGLTHMREQRDSAVALLLDLLEDPDCACDAVTALARLGESSRARTETSLRHSDPWVRKEVERALASFEGVSREEKS